MELLKYTKLDNLEYENLMFSYYPKLFEYLKPIIFQSDQDGNDVINIRADIDQNALAILKNKTTTILQLYDYILKENLKRYANKQNRYIELTDENAAYAYQDLAMRKKKTDIRLEKFTSHLNLLLNHQSTLMNYGNNELNRLYKYLDYYTVNSNTYYEKMINDSDKSIMSNDTLENIHVPNPLLSIKFTFKEISNNYIFLNKYLDTSNDNLKLVLYCQLLKMFLLCREYDIRYGKTKLIGYYIHKDSIIEKIKSNDFINHLIVCNFWLPFTNQ